MLSTEEVAARALELVRRQAEHLLAEYARRFGKVLNADSAAELFPDYAASLESRTRYRVAVHPAAQWLRDELFRRALADPDVKEVVFTAGGNGAGKTVGTPTSDVVMDTTLSNPVHAKALIDRALDAGKRVVVAYTYRPIAEALLGVLERARVQGRTVSIDTLIETHAGAAISVSELYRGYGANPKVEFRFVDNSSPEPEVGTIALTTKEDYVGTREQLHAILESRRSEIPHHIYEATRGKGGKGPGTGGTGGSNR